MRWMPLELMLIISLISAIYIFNTIKEFNKRRFYLASLIYLTFLGTILFSPLSFDGTGVYLMPLGIGSVNLHKIIIDLGFVENIILTIPLGFLIKQRFSKISIIPTILLGLSVGATIETIQFYLSHWFLINRTSDINDVIANGMGIFIGATCMVIYRYAVKKKLLSRIY